LINHDLLFSKAATVTACSSNTLNSTVCFRQASIDTMISLCGNKSKYQIYLNNLIDWSEIYPKPLEFFCFLFSHFNPNRKSRIFMEIFCLKSKNLKYSSGWNGRIKFYVIPPYYVCIFEIYKASKIAFCHDFLGIIAGSFYG
jgi:hypothetical protein